MGDLRYVSMNVIDGWTQSRRDDLIALGHVLISLLLGSLPWCEPPAPFESENAAVIRQRKATPHLSAWGGDCPPVFKEFLSYALKLNFTTKPGYDGLIENFKRYQRTVEPNDETWHSSWLARADPEMLSPIPQHPCATQPDDIDRGRICSEETGIEDMLRMPTPPVRRVHQIKNVAILRA